MDILNVGFTERSVNTENAEGNTSAGSFYLHNIYIYIYMCVCVTCLRINPSREFRSKVTRRNFISRIEATCPTPNLIYLITCKVCGKEGVGSTEYLPARISNYYSHIKKKKRTNKISIHFQESQNHTAEDMDIQIIDKLLTIPKDPKELTLKLKRVEGFWQAHLRTVGENGLNSVDELLRNLFHSKDRQFRKVFNNA